MGYEKRYRTVVPVPQDQASEDDVVVWLTRESFDRKAETESLIITVFTDAGTMKPEDVPPKVEKQLGKPATEFVWRVFEGVGARA